MPIEYPTQVSTNMMTTRPPVIIPDEWIMILLQLLPNDDDRIHEKNHNGEDSTTTTTTAAAAGMDADDGYYYRWRIRMSRSIEELRTTLDLYQSAVRRGNDDTGPPPEWPRSIEPLLTQLRTDGQYYATTIIPQECQRIASFFRFLSTTEPPPVVVVAGLTQLLLSEHLLQLQCEERMLSQVLYPTLDTCYDEDDDASTRTDVNLQYCGRTLQRRRQSMLPDHLDLLLQHIHQQQQEEEILGDNHQSRRTDAVVSRSSLLPEQWRRYFVPSTNEHPSHPTNDHESNPTTTLPTTNPTNEELGSILHATSRTTYRTIRDAWWNGRHTTTPTNGNDGVEIVVVIGSVGSGKTFICHQFEEELIASCSTPSTISVIRPKLPMDLLQQGSMLGQVEDTIISLFSSIQQLVSNNRSVVVILDDVEHIVGTISNDNGSSETPLVRRCRSIFMALVDCIQNQTLNSYQNQGVLHPKVLFLLTASSREILSSLSFHVNHIYYLEPPDENERKQVFQKFILKSKDRDDESIDVNKTRLLNDMIDLTVGKSYAEIVQICRQSVERVSARIDVETLFSGNDNMKDMDTSLLTSMKEIMQNKTPESLRGGEYIDGYVNMRVFSGRDLLELNEPGMSASNALKAAQLFPSSSNSSAWKALQASIIIPLCRLSELNELLDTTKQRNAKTIVGAVLLSGESGSGKTAIALRCARYAAELLPSVKLIDVNCTSMIHKEVGASEQAIHRLFDAARRAAPAILLLDGIETIAAVRGNDATTEGTMDRILSTLLVELDGIDDNTSNSSQGTGIAVIGITHDETWIDPALKRPGRLDRAIHMTRDWA